jgi:hypothetical protein
MEITETDIMRMQESLSEIKDPRRTWGNIRHKLVDMLVIALSSVIIGEDEFEATGEWGKGRMVRTFLELPNGIADADTFSHPFERVNPKELLDSLNQWLPAAAAEGEREVNIGGKMLCGGGKKVLHAVSTWAGEQDIVLGRLAAEEKSNEITAIPRVLGMIDVKGDAVTIDAAGCQTVIAKKMREKEADYILAAKGNQPGLCENIRDYFEYLGSKEGRKEPRGFWESVAVVNQLGQFEGRGHGKTSPPLFGTGATELLGNKPP